MSYWTKKRGLKAYPPATKCNHGWGCLVGIGGVGNVAMLKFYVARETLFRYFQETIRRVRSPRKLARNQRRSGGAGGGGGTSRWTSGGIKFFEVTCVRTAD
jgi:hypothetical protein